MKRSYNIFILSFGMMLAQMQAQDQAKKLSSPAIQDALSSAATALYNGEFADGEVGYRKAIALNDKKIAAYNLGNEYYQRGQNQEALMRYRASARDAATDQEKHRAFHNLGNAFMAEKQYQEAVEAYKNALRGNPTDDESRYNLALAKELLEKNPPPPSDDQDQDDQKDKEQEQEQNQDQDQDSDKDGDSEDQQDPEDQEDQKDQGKDQKDKEGNDPNQDSKSPPKPKNTPGQLSPQQVKNLLEAMNNEEKKVQDKMNLQKLKGAKVNSAKDW